MFSPKIHFGVPKETRKGFLTKAGQQVYNLQRNAQNSSKLAEK